MTDVTQLLSMDREDMSEADRALFLSDLKRVTDEYFECADDATLEVTRADGGFLVCVLLTARRIKTVKTPI